MRTQSADSSCLLHLQEAYCVMNSGQWAFSCFSPSSKMTLGWRWPQGARSQLCAGPLWPPWAQVPLLTRSGLIFILIFEVGSRTVLCMYLAVITVFNFISVYCLDCPRCQGHYLLSLIWLWWDVEVISAFRESLVDLPNASVSFVWTNVMF